MERKIMDEMRAAVRLRHESPADCRCLRLVRHPLLPLAASHPRQAPLASEEKLTNYLTACAGTIAAKTQTQRLCAIKRYYEQVLKNRSATCPSGFTPSARSACRNGSTMTRSAGCCHSSPARRASWRG